MRTTALIVSVACAVAWGSTKKKCERPATQLYEYSRMGTVSDDILRKSREIIRKLPPKCLDDEIVVLAGDQPTTLGSVTYLLGRICQKSKSRKAVNLYMDYRIANWESADEELSLSLERVFVSKPDAVLAFIQGQHDTVRTQILNDIVWGFLSNRTYGAENPYEDRTARKRMKASELPTEVLNRKTYKKIFYRLHEDMGRLSEKYARDVEYVLEEIRKYLETWGVEY